MAKSIAEMFDLHGQVAVVTGGAVGIGKAIALRLSEAGAKVLVVDINREAGKAAAEQITAAGGHARAFEANVAVVADAEKAVQFAVDTFGDVDILLNNAGVYPVTPALEVTEELWDRTLDVNLKSMMFCSKAAAAMMIKLAHGGRIVNIASIDALRPSGNLGPYDASKAGMVMLTKSLAKEWARYRIRVNAIAPGGIATPGMASGRTLEAIHNSFALPDIPLRRLGQPDDVAMAALFLACDASAYMTGSLLVLDGGFLLA